MVNWFDLIRQAQGGDGIENFARQFGLSPQQTSAAVAALMPAFAMGLQRAATDPTAMTQLFRVMSGGHFPSFWEAPGQAFSPQARQEGKELLDQLFGSDEVSRRVAHQAAAFSGVGVDVLQQMLPLVAGIVAGGLARMAAGQGALMSTMGQAAGGTGGGQTGAGAWADLWGQWLGAGTQPEAKPEPVPEPPKPEPATNPFEEMMAAFLRASGPPRAEPGSAPVPQQPEAKAPEPKQRASKQPEKPQPSKPSGEAQPQDPAQDPFQAWGDMMEKGQELQRQHLEALQSIFANALARGGGRPER